MENKKKKIFSCILFELISALIVTCSIIPAFDLIGDLFAQIAVTSVLIFVFLLISDPKKITPITVSHSLIFMTGYWVCVALVKQVKLHIAQGDTSFNWLYMFYFDKPAMIVVAFAAVALFFAVKFIINFDDENFVSQYKTFQKTTLISFSVYYVLLMIYCFFLVRGIGGTDVPINLIPFKFFEEMKAGDFEYEYIFLLIGNIAVFTPLGIIIPAIFKNKFKFFQIVLPIILSVGVEFIQFVTKNGYPDIDDVIFNVIGFYIGFLVKILLDKIITKTSKGKFNSIFIF